MHCQLCMGRLSRFIPSQNSIDRPDIEYSLPSVNTIYFKIFSAIWKKIFKTRSYGTIRGYTERQPGWCDPPPSPARNPSPPWGIAHLGHIVWQGLVKWQFSCAAWTATIVPKLNTNIEIRNSKQILNSNDQMTETGAFRLY